MIILDGAVRVNHDGAAYRIHVGGGEVFPPDRNTSDSAVWVNGPLPG
jgi:hypothetical protein